MEKQLFEIKLKELGKFVIFGRRPKAGEVLEDDRVVWVPNPTVGPCSDCERVVTDRRIQHKKEFLGTERQQWRKKCLECRDILGHSNSVE